MNKLQSSHLFISFCILLFVNKIVCFIVHFSISLNFGTKIVGKGEYANFVGVNRILCNRFCFFFSISDLRKFYVRIEFLFTFYIFMDTRQFYTYFFIHCRFSEENLVIYIVNSIQCSWLTFFFSLKEPKNVSIFQFFSLMLVVISFILIASL